MLPSTMWALSYRTNGSWVTGWIMPINTEHCRISVCLNKPRGDHARSHTAIHAHGAPRRAGHRAVHTYGSAADVRGARSGAPHQAQYRADLEDTFWRVLHGGRRRLPW